MCNFTSLFIFYAIVIFSVSLHAFFPPSDGSYTHLYPKLCLTLNILDGEHVLPYFMGFLEDIRYPKDQININFLAKENSSISDWVHHFPLGLYRSIISTNNDGNWREKALAFGRRQRCSFLLIMDTDAYLFRDTLRHLISLDKIVVSPLLYSPFETYTNAEDLKLSGDFTRRKTLNFIRVYYSKGPLLINLKHQDSSYLTFAEENLSKYSGSSNPIDVFAASAFSMDIEILFTNHYFYGFFIDSLAHSRTEHMAIFSTFLANWVSDTGPMSFPISVALPPWYPVTTKLGFDEVYLINLNRRPERLRKMEEILHLVGIQFKRIEAVDGQNLTQAQLSSMKFMPGYLDPFHKRPMKVGEIGCFLSHYKVWEDITHNEHQRSIVLEDDVRFTQNGTLIINQMMEDLMKTRLDWDLIYLGRKKVTKEANEFFVPGHRFLSTISYSYWTIGYAISLNGARKLLKARPLERMLALDEFLPIMYNQHPNPNWSSKFESKDLRAFAVYPVAVEPEKYTHQPGYVSDTENSPIIVELRLEDNEKKSEEYVQDMGKGEITTEGIAEMQRDIKIKDEF